MAGHSCTLQSHLRGGWLPTTAATRLRGRRSAGRGAPRPTVGRPRRSAAGVREHSMTKCHTAEYLRGPAHGPTPAPGTRTDYGVTTGQATVPVVVQAIRPWTLGLIGVVAATWSASTWSMTSRVATRLVTFG
jgi:hypothetical protein